LEAVPISARCPGLAKIVVDDVNALAGPAKQACTLDQAVLQLSALLVMADLSRR
jgi:hypothetical protein